MSIGLHLFCSVLLRSKMYFGQCCLQCLHLTKVAYTSVWMLQPLSSEKSSHYWISTSADDSSHKWCHLILAKSWRHMCQYSYFKGEKSGPYCGCSVSASVGHGRPAILSNLLCRTRVEISIGVSKSGIFECCVAMQRGWGIEQSSQICMRKAAQDTGKTWNAVCLGLSLHG